MNQALPPSDHLGCESFTATASSTGTITIGFSSVKDNAQINGIEIQPA
jgi:hypothetical protein